MNIRSVLHLPLIVASLGLMAGNYNDNKQGQDCVPLCYAGPVLDCDSNFDVYGGAIYGQVRVQGSEIAANIDRAGTFYPHNGSIIQQTETPSWGFKVGLGYKNWVDNWRSFARYTWFKSISNLDYESSVGQLYQPSAYANQYVENFQIPQTFGFLNLQTGNYTLFNNLNLAIGRPTLVTENLELTTSYGVAATWLTRRQLSVFTNNTDGGAAGSTVLFASTGGGYFQNYQKYMWWGVGPMVNLRSVFYLGSGVGIYADTYLALTYGASDVRTSTFSKRNNGTVPVPSFQSNEAALQNKMFQFSPEYNFQLGFNWSQTYREDSIKASFMIGYETAYYQQVIKTLTNEIAYRNENSSGLGFQGLVITAMLDF
jgi:hypothetical protein